MILFFTIILAELIPSIYIERPVLSAAEVSRNVVEGSHGFY